MNNALHTVFTYIQLEYICIYYITHTIFMIIIKGWKSVLGMKPWKRWSE